MILGRCLGSVARTLMCSILSWCVTAHSGAATAASISPDSEACIECHVTVTPGVVADWEKSRHARVSPQEAFQKPTLELRVSAEQVPERLAKTTVGCAECHTLDSEKHADHFEHQGYTIHLIVTPRDCSTCHPAEADQYSNNLMSHGYVNLVNNPLFQDLMESINGGRHFEEGRLTSSPSDALTQADSCLFCHGTRVEVKGKVMRETDMGPMEFPDLSGWPNQGVGRINPDGSQASCTSCHTRHQFAIEMARKPATCSECHKGPDVPASKVFEVSKHGNLYESMGGAWNFTTVPWTVGKDITGPTCATCHVSLLVNSEGTIIAPRTHQMNDRLPWRLFGLPYAHAHPKSPDTTVIKSASSLPLPTDLDGTPSSSFLIDAEEQSVRQRTLQGVCASCHATGWIQGHWDRFLHTIQTTNEMTLTTTRILFTAWDKGLARGPAQKESPFDESIEKKWVEQWLFYANSVRFSSAMCGADYGVFENGRWNLSKNPREVADWLEARMAREEKDKSTGKDKPPGKGKR